MKSRNIGRTSVCLLVIRSVVANLLYTESQRAREVAQDPAGAFQAGQWPYRAKVRILRRNPPFAFDRLASWGRACICKTIDASRVGSMTVKLGPTI